MERLKTAAILALLAMLAGSVAWAATGGEAEVRITARQLEDGRVEFVLQQRVNGGWGERMLPASRFFPANVEHSRWLNSTPVTVSVAAASEAPRASLTRGDPGKWQSSVIGADDWDGAQGVKMTLDNEQGDSLSLMCKHDHLFVDVVKRTSHWSVRRVAGADVQYRFSTDGERHSAEWLYVRDGYRYEFSPDVLNDVGAWVRSLIGKTELQMQFKFRGSSLLLGNAAFDLRGMTNAEAWPNIVNCGR